MRISVYGSRELRTVILGMKELERDTRKELRQQTKAVVDPAWRAAVAENVTQRMESAVLASTARVAISDQNVQLKSASVGRSLRGGGRPSEIWHAVEFGADREKTRTYTATSRKGRTFTVHNRHTRHHLRARNRKGYVIMPAAAEVIPRMAALWTQTIVRTLHEKLEGR